LDLESPIHTLALTRLTQGFPDRQDRLIFANDWIGNKQLAALRSDASRAFVVKASLLHARAQSGSKKGKPPRDLPLCTGQI
jgi:hypothetical protein